MASDGFPYPVDLPGNFSVNPNPTAEQLKPFGYAPGSYQMKCSVCRTSAYNVDKRAMRCWQCAVNAFRAAEARKTEAPSEPYRPVEERCEILAVEMSDAGNQEAANVLYEAEALIRGLRKSVVFWIGMYGEAIDALDECAGDDAEGWDRQQHAETMAAKLRTKHATGGLDL